MAGIKLKITTDGEEKLNQVGTQLQNLRKHAQTSTTVFKDFNGSLSRLNRGLAGAGAVSGIATQFQVLNGAALAATTAINGASVAMSTLSGASKATGVAVGLVLTAMAGLAAFTQFQEKKLTGPALELLAEQNAKTAAAIKRTIDEGGLKADEFTLFVNELERVKSLKPEEAADALAKLFQKLRDIKEENKRLFLNEREGREQTLAMQQLQARGAELDGASEKEKLKILDRQADTLDRMQAADNDALLNKRLITKEEWARLQLQIEQERLRVREEKDRVGRHPLRDFERALPNMRESIEGAAVSPFQGIFEGVSTSLQGLLNLTMSWGDALRNIGTNIVGSIIKGFSDMVGSWITSVSLMVAKWAWAHIVMKGILAAYHFFARLLGWESTNTAIQQETAKAPSLASNAATASIGSYGAAAVVGTVLAVAAIAAIIAAALGAFSAGGYTGNADPRSIAGVVHGREFVFSAPAVQRIGVENLAAMHRGDTPASVGGGRGGRPTMVFTGGISKRDALEVLRGDPEAEAWIMDTVGKNMHRLRA